MNQPLPCKHEDAAFWMEELPAIPIYETTILGPEPYCDLTQFDGRIIIVCNPAGRIRLLEEIERRNHQKGGGA